MGTRMRVATLPTQPQQNENHRLVRMVFKKAELLASSINAVEQSTYFAGGRSPVHAESDSEEIIYFRRGKGQVLRGNEYVDVGPGSAVTIPLGMRHHVVNTGEDTLEHILISADLNKPKPKSEDIVVGDDFVVPPDSPGMDRLACRKMVIEPGQNSERVVYADRESVYAISSGFAIAHVGLPEGDYEWQYAIDGSNCVWLPPGRPHFFRNVGDCPLHLTGFLCLTG
jgi:mannose-6-phosphate isomerase-like protein (cupin superfamily)